MKGYNLHPGRFFCYPEGMKREGQLIQNEFRRMIPEEPNVTA